MKILFICKGNNCRSQIAETIYNHLTNSSDASSAGTRVEIDGETLAEFDKRNVGKSYTLNVMRDAGFNLKNNRQKKLTKDMLKKYDLIVNMAAKRYTPNWLASAPNSLYWKVTDPRGRSYAITLHAKKVIEQKIHKLLKS